MATMRRSLSAAPATPSRLDELFTDDFVYDVEALGYGSLEGAEAFVEAPVRWGTTKSARAPRHERVERSSTRTSFAGRAPGGGSPAGPWFRDAAPSTPSSTRCRARRSRAEPAAGRVVVRSPRVSPAAPCRRMHRTSGSTRQ